jgi:hypothetical protein
MAYVKVDTSVPRNRNCYCQDALTDGFIPDEALPYLGVKNAAQLADHLVKAGLWHKEGDGYRVNDYLDHNRSASEVQAIKEERRKAGASGGKASGQARRWTDEPNGDSTLKQVASGESKQPANPVQISTDQYNADQKKESAEPLRDSSPAVLVFPTVGTGAKEWTLTESQVADWKHAYPGSDVIGECRRALAWIQANQSKRKTAKGMPAFLLSWLNRSVNGQPAAPITRVGGVALPAWAQAAKEGR